MSSEDDKYRELEQRIAALTARVYQLEAQLGQRDGTNAGIKPAPTEEVPVTASVMPAATEQPSRSRGLYARASLETKIGGQWLNRVGIVAVLIGVSYFLKYAFDNNWVGPAGRVVIGSQDGILYCFG